MDTKPPPLDECKLSHLDEYKMLRDEITLYQQEIHRTWLWAIITAGAIYTWLVTHRADINALPKSVSILLLFLPTFFLIVCCLRYYSFTHRINTINKYLLKVEEDAFGQENNSEFSGFLHFSEKTRFGGFSHSVISLNITIVLWLILICCSGFCSGFLSFKLL